MPEEIIRPAGSPRSSGTQSSPVSSVRSRSMTMPHPAS